VEETLVASDTRFRGFMAAGVRLTISVMASDRRCLLDLLKPGMNWKESERIWQLQFFLGAP
jgi:hypothetical protein